MEPSEIKPITEFAYVYPQHADKVLQYPTATHYRVDGRGSLVLMCDGRTLTYISNIMDGDVEL
jgi:hypothetical protein